MQKVLVLLLIIMHVACSRGALQPEPVLYFMDSNYLYILHSDKSVYRYDPVKDYKELLLRLDSSLSSPIELVVKEDVIYVFSTTGSVLLQKIKRAGAHYVNTGFSGLTGVTPHSERFLIAGTQGLLMCNDSLDPMFRIACDCGDSCEKQGQVLPNGHVVAYEYYNGSKTARIKVYDSYGVELNELMVPGDIGGWEELKIGEIEGGDALIFCNAGYDEFSFLRWEYKKGEWNKLYTTHLPPIKNAGGLVFLSTRHGTSLIAVSLKDFEEQWSYSGPGVVEDVIAEGDYIGIVHQRGTDVLERATGNIVRSVHGTGHLKSFFYQSNLLIVHDNGEVSQYSLGKKG